MVSELTITARQVARLIHTVNCSNVNQPHQRGKIEIRTPVLEHMVQDFRGKTVVHSHNDVEAKVAEAVIS